MHKFHKGFTLMELIAVMAFMAVAITITVPTLANIQKHKNMVVTETTMQQFELDFKNWYDYGGSTELSTFYASEVASGASNPYTLSPQIIADMQSAMGKSWAVQQQATSTEYATAMHDAWSKPIYASIDLSKHYLLLLSSGPDTKLSGTTVGQYTTYFENFAATGTVTKPATDDLVMVWDLDSIDEKVCTFGDPYAYN